MTSAAVEASIGWIGCSTASRTASSAAWPSVSAERRPYARGHPRASRPGGRRAIGTSAAVATPSVMIPASAPCRSSPVRSRRTKSASASVARPNRSVSSACRAACEPAPDVRGQVGEDPVQLEDLDRRLGGVARRPACTPFASRPRCAPGERHRSGTRPQVRSPRDPRRGAARTAPPPWPCATASRRRRRRWRRGRRGAHRSSCHRMRIDRPAGR